MALSTSSLMTARARRTKRCRLPRLLPLGLDRRSMKCRIGAGPLPRFADARVPLHQAAHLPLGVAARRHALHELRMLAVGLAVLLGAEADHRQQVLDLGEHALLN